MFRKLFRKSKRKPQASEMNASKNIKEIEFYKRVNTARETIKEANNRLEKIKNDKNSTRKMISITCYCETSRIVAKYYSSRGFTTSIIFGTVYIQW